MASADCLLLADCVRVYVRKCAEWLWQSDIKKHQEEDSSEACGCADTASAAIKLEANQLRLWHEQHCCAARDKVFKSFHSVTIKTVHFVPVECIIRDTSQFSGESPRSFSLLQNSSGTADAKDRTSAVYIFYWKAFPMPDAASADFNLKFKIEFGFSLMESRMTCLWTVFPSRRCRRFLLRRRMSETSINFRQKRDEKNCSSHPLETCMKLMPEKCCFETRKKFAEKKIRHGEFLLTVGWWKENDETLHPTDSISIIFNHKPSIRVNPEELHYGFSCFL